jgi:hypothetical protein
MLVLFLFAQIVFNSFFAGANWTVLNSLFAGANWTVLKSLFG